MVPGSHPEGGLIPGMQELTEGEDGRTDNKAWNILPPEGRVVLYQAIRYIEQQESTSGHLEYQPVLYIHPGLFSIDQSDIIPFEIEHGLFPRHGVNIVEGNGNDPVVNCITSHQRAVDRHSMYKETIISHPGYLAMIPLEIVQLKSNVGTRIIPGDCFIAVTEKEEIVLC